MFFAALAVSAVFMIFTLRRKKIDVPDSCSLRQNGYDEPNDTLFDEAIFIRDYENMMNFDGSEQIRTGGDEFDGK